jgi:cobalt-precorrin 5A hydrolase/precorrin-3B C17-methyltransferase
MTRTSDAPVPAISDTTSRARVYFIGAGPGDPELLTLKAQRLIASADLILYAGSLVNPAVLHHARPEARRHNSAGMPLDEQIALMRRAVETGQTVVRLHTGDPSVFGAIMEQMQALDRLGIAYEIVPGVSSVFAAAAALGIELTLPESTQTVILTRLGGQTPTPASEALRDLAAHRTSLAIFLSVGMLERVVEELLAAGYPPDAPIAVVFRASWPDQRVVRATLRTIVAQVRDAEITHQALIIVGPPLALPSGDQPGARSHLYGGATQPPQREPTRAIVTLTRAGTRTGLRLLAGLPDCVLYAPTRHLPDSSVTAGNGDIRPYDVAVRQVLQDAFHRHSGLVCIMASGIVVRDLAPLLGSKHTDPGVVVVDTAGRYAVSLLAGHVGGGNRLAHEVAACLGGDAVVTTASDVHDLPALDLLGPTYGWRLEDGAPDGRMTRVIGALVNGEAVGVWQEAGSCDWWPDPPPANLARYATLAELQAAAPAAAVVISHRRVPDSFLAAVPDTIIYRPPVLVVGVGCNRNTPADEILAAIDTTLDEAGLARASVAQVTSVADKADEAGLVAACAARGWPLRTFSRHQLAAVTGLPNPSPWAQRELGVPGVAEPAALLGAGADHLLVEKRRFPNVTVAVARRADRATDRAATPSCRASGAVTVVSIGPGSPELLTPAARQALERADLIVGYHTYLDLIRSVAPGVPRYGSGMRQEVQRVAYALERAQEGQRVVVVSGGDAGIYGMAGLVLEMCRARGCPDLPVTVIPGVSALNAAAALLGAPLMNDFATISLSDQLTPREAILRRLEAAAQADYVVCLYNPRGRQRTELYAHAVRLLSDHRRPDTPVGVVRAAYRPDQAVHIATLADLPTLPVDMVTLVVVGNSHTFVHNGYMITPRGYAQHMDLGVGKKYGDHG